MEILDQLKASIPKGVVSLRDFNLERELGAGGFGKVMYGVHRATGMKCAVKILFVDDYLPEDLMEDFAHEVEMLWKCRFPFVLALTAFTIEPPLAIITPYVNSGSLYDYTRQNNAKARLDGTQKSLIAIGVAYGMMHLHKAHVIHRDLKSMNILLDSRLLPFICDFGIAKSVEGKNIQMTQDCGTTYWMAPEQISTSSYDSKVDVYSYGMVLYEMLCERIPFQGDDPLVVAQSVVGGSRPGLPDSEPQVEALIRMCWHQDPEKRPTFETVYKWLSGGKYLWENTNAKALKAMDRLIKGKGHTGKK
jgi:serine/threonine protein kinase